MKLIPSIIVLCASATSLPAFAQNMKINCSTYASPTTYLEIEIQNNTASIKYREGNSAFGKPDNSFEQLKGCNPGLVVARSISDLRIECSENLNSANLILKAHDNGQQILGKIFLPKGVLYNTDSTYDILCSVQK